MSTRPKRSTAASTRRSQIASLVGARGDLLDLRAALAAFGGHFAEFPGLARGQHEFCAGGSERLRRDRPERAGGAGNQRDLVADGKQRERIGRGAGHGFAPGG